MSEKQSFESWGIVEVMGHQTYCGLISEETIGGQSFVRVDIPDTPGQEKFTKFFGAGAIYAITPTTEEIARSAAQRHVRVPISVYDLPQEWQEKLRQPLIESGSKTWQPGGTFDDDIDFGDDCPL